MGPFPLPFSFFPFLPSLFSYISSFSFLPPFLSFLFSLPLFLRSPPLPSIFFPAFFLFLSPSFLLFLSPFSPRFFTLAEMTAPEELIGLYDEVRESCYELR